MPVPIRFENSIKFEAIGALLLARFENWFPVAGFGEVLFTMRHEMHPPASAIACFGGIRLSGLVPA